MVSLLKYCAPLKLDIRISTWYSKNFQYNFSTFHFWKKIFWNTSAEIYFRILLSKNFVPIKSNIAKIAVKSLLHNWIIKFGPPIYLVTDRGSRYINTDIAQPALYSHGNPSYSYNSLLPLEIGLVEVQNKILGTHLRMFLQNTSKTRAHQVHVYAFAHDSQPLSPSNVPPHEIVFHPRPRIPLTFNSILSAIRTKHLFPNIAPIYQNIHTLTKQIRILSFIVHFLNLSSMVSCRRNCHVTKSIHTIWLYSP